MEEAALADPATAHAASDPAPAAPVAAPAVPIALLAQADEVESSTLDRTVPLPPVAERPVEQVVAALPEAPPEAAPEGVVSEPGLDVAVELSEPTSELGVPVEVSEPQGASGVIDISVDYASAASNPTASEPVSLADLRSDLDAPAPAAAVHGGTRGVPGAEILIEVERGKWQPSRTLFFVVAGVAVLLVGVLFVFMRGRAEEVTEVTPSVAIETSVAAATEPTASVEVDEPVTAPDEDEPADPMAAAGSSDDEEPAESGQKKRPRRRRTAPAPKPGPTESPNPAPAPEEAAPTGTGTLNIYSTPPAPVFVDGRPLGLTPRQINLPSGPHTVVVEDPELGRQTVTVDVKPKKQHSVNLTLAQ
ncbi:MAG: PEGA domain-containing protein [Polyangiaceae bacterium]|nr:PEGA domain-containing protein [Polyangiaceae bacterium]